MKSLLTALCVIVISGPMAAHQVQPISGAVSEFDNCVKAYIALRARVDNDAPRRQLTQDTHKLQEAQRSLAVRIRNARVGARQGDVFGPGITELLRAFLNREVKGAHGAKTAASIEDERAMVELKVNGDYPERQPLASVPPAFLQAMPRLPLNEDLEYRFVGRHLILLDTRAHLIVDFVFNALPIARS